MTDTLNPGHSLGIEGSIHAASEAKPISATKTDQSMILPPGARPQRLFVPAYWDLSPKYDQQWQDLKRAGSVVDVTVIEESWPAAAENNVHWRDNYARPMLDSLESTVLGYVSTRVSADGPMRPIEEILDGTPNRVKGWYEQFGQQIDGIYFDELVLPNYPADIPNALALVSQFKARYPTAKVMILAGQSLDERVVDAQIDWTLLWETDETAYRKNFLAMEGEFTKPIPAWWKDPKYRQKIVHTVHGCEEPARQHVLGLANERNAGNVFVMDQRIGGRYDHLPPYWHLEVREANSYYDFGFDPLKVLRAAHRYGTSQGKLHAWPNFEGAWYSTGHVRGTYLLDAGQATKIDVLRSDLGDPFLFDIPAIWSAAHRYAQTHGFETAMPTFEEVSTPDGIAFSLIAFPQATWLTVGNVKVGQTYQRPTFAEPGSVIRNVNRVAANAGYAAAFPTFVPANAAEPKGINPDDPDSSYNCYFLSSHAPIQWSDVPTEVYIQQL